MALHDQEIRPVSAKTYATIENARKAAIKVTGTMPVHEVQYVITLAENDRFVPLFFLRPEQANHFHYFVNKGFSTIIR